MAKDSLLVLIYPKKLELSRIGIELDKHKGRESVSISQTVALFRIGIFLKEGHTN